MKMMLLLALFGTAFALGIAVMINGWGLTPESWSWVIFGGFASFFFAAAANAVGEMK